MFAGGSMIGAMPFVLFLTFIGVVYISLSYKLERTQKSINSLKDEIEELTTEFVETTTKINTKSIQSEVITKVEKFGLNEMTKSPLVIVKR
jgi:uncharacterized protein YoxC